MTRVDQHFYKVGVERLRMEVAHLHYEAVRDGHVAMEAWSESVDRELAKWLDRIDGEVIYDGVKSPALSSGVLRGETVRNNNP